MIAYINGRYLPLTTPSILPEDRGYQFADGVYEVYTLFDGVLIDEQRHLARLQRSLKALAIRPPISQRGLRLIVKDVIARNALTYGLVYIQITRGVAPRAHVYRAGIKASLVVIVRPLDFAAIARQQTHGVAVRSFPDERWARCDIKSIALLSNVLARQAAYKEGASEAWLINDKGEIVEGAASTAWVVTMHGEIRTHPTDAKLLPGITRERLLEALRAKNYPVKEQAVHMRSLPKAREAFLTTSTGAVIPVIKVNDIIIGNGKPGPIAKAFRNFDRLGQKARIQSKVD